MEFFLNPWAMVAGGAMISAPILIHLINRLRFKRIRWAAMEFLLKSQNRTRRRLIIEQIILLMLRCLMMVLAGLLLARFLGFRPPSEVDGKPPQSGTLHVLLLDDTLSMTDRAPVGRGNITDPDAFSLACKRINELAERSSKVEDKVQHLRVVLMSTQQVLFEGNPREPGALDLLARKLKEVKPKLLHAPAINGLKKCKELLDQPPVQKVAEAPGDANKKKDDKDNNGDKEKKDKEETGKPLVSTWHKRLHVYSDFRDSDWGRRVDTQALYGLMDKICETGANVSLVDAAAPPRPAAADLAVRHHDNYAITDLRPEKRIAPGNSVVSFTCEITNYGSDTRDRVLLDVFVDGAQDFGATKEVEAPGPGRTARPTFDILFTSPDEGVPSKYHRVTARLASVDGESGLLADNIRHTTIEIRRDVPTLVIDGSGEAGVKPGGDTNVIKNALESAKGSETTKIVTAGLSELLREDLEREYAAICLVNVENLQLPDAKKGEEDLPMERLRQFVRNGGNVVYFTGPKINVKYYNETLFEGAKGLFPVELEKQSEPRIDDAEIEKRRSSSAPKIYIVDPEHPITAGIAPLQYSIPDLIFTQYTPTKLRFTWGRPWSKKDDLKELITLANLQKVADATRTQI